LIGLLYKTMSKVTGPLYPDRLPAFIRKLLNFTASGYVRREGHVTPDVTPGVAMSRLYVKAIDPVSGKIRDELRAQLLAAIPAPSNWAAQITARTIGHSRANWATDAADYAAMPPAARADWIYAADFTGLEDVWIRDTHHDTHKVTAGQAFFHVASGIYRIGVLDQPAQPAEDNAIPWAAFMFKEPIVYPDNALTLFDRVIGLDEDILTL
jgi:hypothetical protein